MTNEFNHLFIVVLLHFVNEVGQIRIHQINYDPQALLEVKYFVASHDGLTTIQQHEADFISNNLLVFCAFVRAHLHGKSLLISFA